MVNLDKDENAALLEPPSIRNFVDFVEHGDSADHDPAKVETADAKEARHKLIKATMICLFFMIFEVIGGYMAGSLAIMTDAAHLLSDVAGFLISLGALYLGNRKATINLSFGFKRAEILGALLSVMLIWFLTGVLIWEAIIRTQGILNKSRDSEVDGKLMFGVAVMGLLVNLTLMFVLGHEHSHLGGDDHGHSHGGGDHGHSHGGGHGHSDHHDEEAGYQNADPGVPKKEKHVNINVSAAYIHAIGDLIQSAGVCIAGALIWAFPNNHNMQLADPIATFLFSLLVLYSTYQIVKVSLNVLMEGVPKNVDPAEIARCLLRIDGVVGVHHLHIWSLTVGEPSLSVHLVVSPGASLEQVLSKAQHLLREKNISHNTIQCERGNSDFCAEDDCDGDDCDAAISCGENGNCYSAFSPGGANVQSKKKKKKKKGGHGHSHSGNNHGHSH